MSWSESETHGVRHDKVRVTMHLPGGYTKVLVEWTYGRMNGGAGICFDVPTNIIPAHLRRIGCRFVLFWDPRIAVGPLTPNEFRAARKCWVEEIKDE